MKNNNPLGLKPHKKVAVFIDGANLYAATRTLGWEVDFKRLRKYLGEACDLFRVYYYTAIAEDDDGSATVRPLVDWLDYNGYTVRSKNAKEFTDSEGRKKVKGNTSVEMVVDLMRTAPLVDQIVIFASDGDLRPAVEYLKEIGNIVTLLSTKETQPPMVSDDLRREADYYFDLHDADVIATFERVQQDGSHPRGPQDRQRTPEKPHAQERREAPARATGNHQGHTSGSMAGVDRTLRMPQRQ